MAFSAIVDPLRLSNPTHAMATTPGYCTQLQHYRVEEEVAAALSWDWHSLESDARRCSPGRVYDQYGSRHESLSNPEDPSEELCPPSVSPGYWSEPDALWKSCSRNHSWPRPQRSKRRNEITEPGLNRHHAICKFGVSGFFFGGSNSTHTQ